MRTFYQALREAPMQLLQSRHTPHYSLQLKTCTPQPAQQSFQMDLVLCPQLLKPGLM